MSTASVCGRNGENAVISHLTGLGVTGLSRPRLSGDGDKLDILGIPHVLISVKNSKQGKGRQRVPDWVRQAEERREQHGALVAVVWTRDVLSMDAGRWSCWLGEASADQLRPKNVRGQRHPGLMRYPKARPPLDVLRMTGAGFVSELITNGYLELS